MQVKGISGYGGASLAYIFTDKGVLTTLPHLQKICNVGRLTALL